MSGTAQIVEAIRKDQHGIGYVSAGYLNEQVLRGLKVLHIVNPNNGFAYSPMDKEAITNGQYPITRPLLQYTDGAPSGVLLDFVKFQFTELGAKIIENNGFYPVKADSTILSL
jgi:phosphate transport system substrate-binding protein